MSKDIPITAPETGKENPAPAFGDGAGDISGTCAETAMAAKITARTKVMKMLTCAIFD